MKDHIAIQGETQWCHLEAMSRITHVTGGEDVVKVDPGQRLRPGVHRVERYRVSRYNVDQVRVEARLSGLTTRG